MVQRAGPGYIVNMSTIFRGTGLAGSDWIPALDSTAALEDISQAISTAFIIQEAIDRHVLSEATPPITPAQYHALVALSLSPNQGLGDLADRLLCDKANASGLMDRLTALGLATRIRDPQDGRRVVVSLTPYGCDVLEHATQLRLRAMRHTFAPLDPNELTTLRHHLVDLVDLLQSSLSSHE